MASPVSPPTQAVRARCGRVWERLGPVRRRVRRRVEVDTRALAAVRITLATTLLIDLLHRAQHIELFYTDSGVYPVSAYQLTYSDYTGLSIHAWSGTLWFQQLMFLIAGIFAVAFLLGYRTRLVGFVSLLLLFSLHARNPGLLNGGDRLFRVLLFVALVTPLGERFSIDALRRGRARRTVAGFTTAALLAQPLAVFSANAVLKHRGEHWYAGDALEIALANDTMTIFLGNVVAEYPQLLTALNYGWITLLSGSVVLLGLTVGRLRALAALAYISAFLGMFLTMSVGLFPSVLMASVLPFLTPSFWDALARRAPDHWRDRLPSADRLGPLGRRPLERRLLDRLRNRRQPGTAGALTTVARAVIVVAGALLLLWIVTFTAADVTDATVPEAVDYDHLDQQSWGLYAPDPSEGYSWYLVEGELANGTTIDALEGGKLSFDRPPDASKTYETFRHRKYMQRVRDSGRADTTNVIAKRYADWACEQANHRQDQRVHYVTVYRMYQPSPIDGGYEEPYQRTVIERYCGPFETTDQDWSPVEDGDWADPAQSLPGDGLPEQPPARGNDSAGS